MRKLLHEPLVHFIFLGVLIFAGFKFAHGMTRVNPVALLSQGRVESLVTNFTAPGNALPIRLSWIRIREYIREEVYVARRWASTREE
jgi:hypothetical protein